MQTYFAAEIARFLERLKSTPEGNGTMLDNTLVFFFTDFGRKGASDHSHDDLPFHLFGRGGGKVTPGRSISYGDDTHTDAKQAWRNEEAGNRRGRRPAVWTPGETLMIDWGVLKIDGVMLHVFCAVLGWSRFRFVRFAADEKATTTMAMLAQCFEELGGVPKVVLTDRMGCLKAGVVANVVVPTPDFVRFASHYRFRPDFCEAADPESKGMVEALVGYAKTDLMVPLIGSVRREDSSASARWPLATATRSASSATPDLANQPDIAPHHHRHASSHGALLWPTLRTPMQHYTLPFAETATRAEGPKRACSTRPCKPIGLSCWKISPSMAVFRSS